MQGRKRAVWVWLWLGLSACSARGAPATDATTLPQVSLASTPSLLRTRFGDLSLKEASALRFAAEPELQDAGPAARGLFLVQYLPGRGARTRAALTGLGAVVHGWFPDDAWTVGASNAQAQRIATLDDVVAVSPMPTGLKFEQAMVTGTGRSLALSTGPAVMDVWVELADAADADAVRAVVTASGGSIATDGSALQIIRVSLPRAGVAALARMPEVLALEPWTMAHPTNDVSYGVIQGGTAGHAPMWEHGLRGQGQIVGLSDSGVDTDTCWFAGDKIAGYAEFTGLHDGDGSGHGTHVAGSIAGNSGGDGQVHPHGGMAPAARLFVEDVGAGADLVGIPGDLGALFAPAYAAGVRVHSNSWAGGSGTYGVMSRALDRFVAKHPDFLPLFAAGNGGRLGTGTVSEPAVAKNVIAVGALVGAQPDTMAAFSARGPTADGRIKPAIAAPGVSIVSARAGTACGTKTLSGTSMATPTAAGGAALARQYYVDGWYPSGKANPADARDPTAALLRATLLASAVTMKREAGAADRSAAQGFGRMQLDNALVFDADARKTWIHDESQGLDETEAMAFTVRVGTSGESLRIALAWTDPPASPGAAQALVNDLDLEVTGPDGTVYLGNAQGIVAGSAAEADHTNVEEVATIAAAEAGEWRIAVRGTRVPMGAQGFGLVALGDFVTTGIAR